MKEFKKLLTAILFALGLIVISPNILSGMPKVEAAVSLSYKKIILREKDKFTLKLNDNKKQVKWSSSKPSTVSVDQKGKINAKKTGNAIVSAKVGKKIYKCSVKVMTQYEISSQLLDAYNWQCEKIWNNGYCDIYHYIEHGSGAWGQSLNIKKTISTLNNELKFKKKHNNFVTQLQGNKYKKFKKTWNSLYKEMLVLEKCLKKGTPKPNSNFNFPYQKYQKHLNQLLSDTSTVY